MSLSQVQSPRTFEHRSPRPSHIMQLVSTEDPHDLPAEEEDVMDLDPDHGLKFRVQRLLAGNAISLALGLLGAAMVSVSVGRRASRSSIPVDIHILTCVTQMHCTVQCITSCIHLIPSHPTVSHRITSHCTTGPFHTQIGLVPALWAKLLAESENILFFSHAADVATTARSLVCYFVALGLACCVGYLVENYFINRMGQKIAIGACDFTSPAHNASLFLSF